MSCSCLSALLAALQPPWGLLPPINLPPIMAQLGTAAPGFSGLSALASASARAQLSAALALNLPPLPIPPLKLAAAATLAATAGQLKALGINIFSPSAGAQISALINLFGLLPFPQIPLPDIGPLASVCSTLLMVKASLGIDLMAPGAAVALQASLDAMASATAHLGLPSAGSLSVLAQYSAVASLAAACGVGLDFGAMLPKLSLVASLQIPGLPPGLNLAALLHLLAALLAAKNLFGINPLAIGVTAKLGLALEPLKLLASVKMSESLMAAAGAAAGLGSINLSANFSAIASANLSAFASLKLPNLAPLSLVAAVSTQARGMSSCGSGCPISL